MIAHPKLIEIDFRMGIWVRTGRLWQSQFGALTTTFPLALSQLPLALCQQVCC